ncbi:MAG: PorP/SprF family type IX secretion system membrane protein [Bacteroidetes bacterium]|nr:PorP/SprF family type IX secretion system membrane protein [Bacteroidota bacterium]
MKTQIVKIAIFGFIVFLMSNKILKAQDSHMSQYDAMPVLLNPAMTGVLTQNSIRAGAQFRSQWGALASNITSTALVVDAPLKERWGVGGYLLNNQMSKYFNVFNFVLSGAYKITKTDQKKHLLTVGLQGGLIYKDVKDNKLVFDNQYSNGNFDPDLPSGESFSRSSVLLPELNYGLFYGFTDPDKKIHPYLGFSLFHITTPNESFTNSVKSRLPRKWVLHGGCNVNITDDFIIEPKGVYMRQLNVQEIEAGMNLNYNFKESQIILMAGGFYRVKDAAIIQIGVNYRNLVYKMSYDINTSSLKTYSEKRGGLEFSIVFNGLGDKKNKIRPMNF